MTTQTQETRLSDAQREDLLARIDEDGYAVLPGLLPEDLMQPALDAIDRVTIEQRVRSGAGSSTSVKKQNCVDLDPAFRALMMVEPALQLSYDVFGPMFHLNQSNFVSRPNDGVARADYVSSSPWHADGPRPNLFPSVPRRGGSMGLHYLKFGFFLTDLTHGNGGSLQVVRGSHLRPELDGDRSKFHIENFAKDLVQFDCPAGTVVVFHQAQWHAAPPNQSEIERKNVYISYCPTWMRPLDREFPTEEQLAGCTSEERWLLGEWRPAQRWWLPMGDDAARLSRFRRDSERPVEGVVNFD